MNYLAIDYYAISIDFLLAVMILVSLLMVLIVLMQRPKSEGLGAAMGGSMMGEWMGAQATNVLQKTTYWLAAIFFVVGILLSYLYGKSSHVGTQSVVQQQLANAPAPKPVDESAITEEALRKLVLEKSGTQNSGTAASGTNAPAVTGSSAPANPATSGTATIPSGSTPAKSGTDSSSGLDLQAPSMQLGPGGGLDSGGFQLQTGTASSGTDLFHTTGTGSK
ncbi:MAG TPA: preprotein translocase subunit SecG [Chthoniobacteraceae bacterium]|nr:preprotein translocase subunit SecG [Chthoniobacteraceae bacterium]